MPSEQVLEGDKLGLLRIPSGDAGESSKTDQGRPFQPVYFFLFFLVSGFCGLIYETVWLRLAMASFGVTAAMISIVLSVFMGALGLGSIATAACIKRLFKREPRAYLRMYGAVELFIGISATVVPYQVKLGRTLLLHLSNAVSWQSSQYYLLAAIWIAVTLTPYCLCMGATFPLLMSVLKGLKVRESNRSFSYLYLANILGALLGTIASVVFLIELLGFRTTLYVAGILNAALALGAFILASKQETRAEEEAGRLSSPAGNAIHGIPSPAVPYILFMSGFVSMGLEIIWIRQFSPYLGNVVYAFAGILTVYLFSSFWGSQDYRTWIRTHVADECSFSWALLSLAVVLPIATADPLAPIRIGTLELGGVRLSSIVLFCAMTGFLTPLLTDSYSNGDPGRAGKAYGMNVLGCLIGPIFAGFLLLPYLGERLATIALAVPIIALGCFVGVRDLAGRSHVIRPGAKTWLKYVTVALAIAFIISKSHDYESKYPEAWVRRDNSATVIARGKGWDRELVVNGRGMTRLNPITKYIAHLPLTIMERQPKSGLVICFGMGTTFRSMLSWGIPTTAVDLVPSVPKMFGYYFSDAAALSSSPLGRIVVDDGRRYLDGTLEKYDVIVIDPPPPPQAPGSSLLYSKEFYQVAAQHLRSDGVLGTWYPEGEGDIATTASVAKALKESFSYVYAFESFDGGTGIHFLGSMRPLNVPSYAALVSRMPSGAIADLTEWQPENSAEQQLRQVLGRPRSLDEIIANNRRVPPLQDDQPINEYYILRSWFHFYR